jgi:hypothetical protein
MSKEPIAEEWLKKDVFFKSGIVASVEKKNIPKHLECLKKQYRMAEPICSMLNNLFYDDNPLETCVSIENKMPALPFGPANLFYSDTSSYHPWSSLKVGTYSRYNLLHGIVIRNLAYFLSKERYLANSETVGIISPYTAQASVLEKLIKEHINSEQVLASTVHRFQGNEKDIIFLDLADSIGTRPSKFIKAASRYEDGTKLLNVALSRAKTYIILIANFEYLHQHIASNSIVRRTIDIFLQKGINIEDAFKIGPDDWIEGLRNLESFSFDFDSGKSGIFNEGTFYHAFRKDLLDAHESVVIFSPFITQTGTSRWMDIMAGKLSQNVQIKLVTRPAGDQGGVLEDGLKDLIENLISTGLKVDLRLRMHEKFAIIDRKLLWHGSLNIFSHRDTSESMFRIVSPQLCEQMMKFVSAENDDGTQSENPLCPQCSIPMVWKNGRYGVYFECEECGSKIDSRRSTRRHRRGEKKEGNETKSKTCPECGRPIKQRKGKYGWFLGCTGYSRHCDYTEPI